MSAENVLVLGGAGFIGSFLVDGLVAQGHRVRVYDSLVPQVHHGLRDAGAWPDYANPAAEYVAGDIRDREALRQALQGVDVVFHEAAAVGVGQSMYDIEAYVDANTRGTAVLLDILANDSAVRDHVRKLVVASSMSIYGEGAYWCPVHGEVHPRGRWRDQLAARDWELYCPVPMAAPDGTRNGQAQGAVCHERLRPVPTHEDKPLYCTSIYAITKKDQEEMCLVTGQAYGLPVVALRYFNVYGPRQALSNPYTGIGAIFSSRLLNGRPPVIFEDGGQRRDFVHVSDIVQANLLVMNHPEVDGGVFNVGTGRGLTILEVAQILARHLNQPQSPDVTQKFRVGDIRHCYADIRRLQALGYSPRVAFEDGVAELVAWVQSQTAADHFATATQALVERNLVH